MGCRCGAWPRFQDAVSVCTWSGGETPRSELVSVCRVRSSRSVRVSPPFVRLQSTSDREVPICHYIAVFLHIYAPPPYVSRAAAHKPARAHAHTQAKHTSPGEARRAAGTTNAKRIRSSAGRDATRHTSPESAHAHGPTYTSHAQPMPEVLSHPSATCSTSALRRPPQTHTQHTHTHTTKNHTRTPSPGPLPLAVPPPPSPPLSAAHYR